ncbi:autophagy-related protein 22-like protein [Mrakia frigida]|uniref:Atg22p n=1 Tax=Mrakia frigida TaxID=29902 RepID=UPI003FCC0296
MLLLQPEQGPLSEDTLRRRHNRQIWAWWSFAFAAETFAACAMTVFIPICLEQISRSTGFLEPERTVPCPLSAEDEVEGSARCKAKIAGIWVDTASFSLYTYSISVALQALLVVSIGSTADHAPHRKLLLLSFAFVGALSAISFTLISLAPVLALLSIIAIACFGCSFVCSNAYLPDLGKGGEKVRAARLEWEEEAERAREEGGGATGGDSRPGVMLPGVEFSNDDNDASNRTEERAPLLDDLSLLNISQTSHLLQLKNTYLETLAIYTSHISLLAIAIGYSGGVAVLIPSFLLVVAMDGTSLSLRLAVALSGAVWALATLPAARWLGSLKGWRGEGGKEKISWMGEVGKSWRSLGSTLRPKEIGRLKETFWFLLSWMFLSDAAATFSSTAIIFAKTTLKMSSSEVIIVAFLAQISGVFGGLTCPILQRKLGWSNKRCLITLVLIMALLPVYGIIGLFTSVGGLKTPGEMYTVSFFFGLCFGPFQSFARTVFSSLIPPGREARFFGLYSITDKSSSFFGPAAVGLIADLTGEIRYGFVFLLFMLVLPVPLLVWKVDLDKGRERAKVYSEEESRSGSGGSLEE